MSVVKDRTNLILLLAIVMGLALTAWKCHVAVSRSAERKAKAQGCAGNPGPGERFLGRWRLVDERGRTGGWLNVTTRGVSRDHAPGVAGTWECAEDELRIAWDDGFLDVLRVEPDGQMALLAMGEDGGVRFKLHAERR